MGGAVISVFALLGDVLGQRVLRVSLVRRFALGAALGSLGLAVVALVLWRLLPTHSTWGSLGLAVVAWLLVSGAALGFCKGGVEVNQFAHDCSRLCEALG
jgi:hypothetical protein